MKSKRRANLLKAKRLRKAAGMLLPGGKSRYARKRRYLNATGLWGWQVPSPKPWH